MIDDEPTQTTPEGAEREALGLPGDAWAERIVAALAKSHYRIEEGQ